jgi:peptidoglycan hydrolase-like protein with peptidoglycan-binding domain
MRLKDIFEAPPERGPRTNTRPTRPGQEVSGPITRGLPTRPGQDTSGPTPTLPTRPGQDRSGPTPTLPTRPGQDRSGTIPGSARPEGPAAGMPTRPDQSTSGAPTGIRAPGTTTSNLRRGSTGSDVSGLQQMLIDKGYDLGDTGADGKFGPRTAAAVKQFQTDFGLQVDGIAGDQTMSALNRAQGGARPTVGEPGSMPRATPSSTATTGGRGDGNAELQRRRGYQDGLAAAKPPAANTVNPRAATPTTPVAGRSGPTTPGDRQSPMPTIPRRTGPTTPGDRQSPMPTIPSNEFRPLDPRLVSKNQPGPRPNATRFNPNGTVAGPGQNARPGGTPNPVRPTTPRTNRPI